MGSSPYGRLSFGVAFEEDFEFPWSDKEKYDNDISNWWLEVTGYIQPPELHCFKSIYAAERKWLELNPIPVELVRRSSYDYPCFIVATRSTGVEWDETLVVTKEMFNTDEHDTKIITDFLNKYDIKYKGSPSWLLSSFYG